jgi:hypothetical protein
MPASVYRTTLGLVFLGSAFLKTRDYVHGVNGRGALPMLADPVVLWALVVADALIAIGCLLPGRWNAVSAWAAILLVVAGNFVFLDGIRTDRIPSCGCFGPVRLGVVEHVVLAVCVFFLAARTILPSPTSR